MHQANALTKQAIRMARSHVAQRRMFEDIIERREELDQQVVGYYLQAAYHAMMAALWRELA